MKTSVHCLAELQKSSQAGPKTFLECLNDAGYSIARTGALRKYNHNHDVRGRFASSNSGLHSGVNNDTMRLSDDIIPMSLGAKYQNYDIVDALGRVYGYVEGLKVRDRNVFAGCGTQFPPHEGVAEGLTREFGGDEHKWQHVKGIGTIDCDGDYADAEIHCFKG